MRHDRTRTEVPPWPRWLGPTLAVAIILLGGILYGSYSRRWGPPADLVAAGSLVTEMPRHIGPWRMAEELPIEPAAIEMLECAGYVSRRYVHQDNGRSVTVAILVGPPGPIAVHTPEICFSSRAYEIQGQRKAVTMQPDGQTENSFWTVDFRTQSPMADGLRVYYAWSRGDTWKASRRPRYEFAAAPLLYKMQMAFPLAAGIAEEGPDAGRQFLNDLSQSGWMLGKTSITVVGRS